MGGKARCPVGRASFTASLTVSLLISNSKKLNDNGQTKRESTHNIGDCFLTDQLAINGYVGTVQNT